MRIDLKDIILLFEKIQEDMNISYVSIVVFCAVDVDSLCTLKIFSVLLISCRNSSRAKTYSIRYIQSPGTPSSLPASNSLECTSRSSYFCLSTAEAS